MYVYLVRRAYRSLARPITTMATALTPSRRELYATPEPFNTGMLDVGDGHRWDTSRPASSQSRNLLSLRRCFTAPAIALPNPPVALFAVQCLLRAGREPCWQSGIICARRTWWWLHTQNAWIFRPNCMVPDTF